LDSFASTANSLKQISITCGDTVTPLFKSGASIDKELQKSMDFQVSGGVTWSNWQTSCFTIAVDCEALSSVISEFNSSVINQVTSLQTEYSSALPSQLRYDCIVEFDQVIDVQVTSSQIHS